MLVRELERLSQGPDQMNDAEDTGGAAPVRTKVGGSWAW